MINEKMVGLGKKASIIREIFEYSNRRKAQIGNDKVFDFSLGNPSVPAPEKVNSIIKNLLDTVEPTVLHGYTSAPGDASVRQKIAENIAAKYGVKVEPSLIYMTCGAAASLTVSLNALVNEGDEVIALAPFFPEYRVFVEKAGGVLRMVPCTEETLSVDLEAFESAVTAKTKAVIINSPNNPSGVIISESELESMCSILYKKQEEYGTEIFLLSDEPYRQLVYGNFDVPYVTKYYKNSLVCYSFSKSLSIPGERIGYIMVNPDCSNAGDVFAGICGAGRALGFVCAPSLWQRVAAECLDDTSDISVYEKNRNLLLDNLTEYGFTMAKPQGAFYIFMKVPTETAFEFFEKAKEYELLVVPSDDFGFKGYVRISYCVSTEQIERSLPAFKKLAEFYNL